MKKLILTLVLFYSAFSLNAQTEVKINPFFLLFEGFQIGVEQIVSNDWGIDGDLFVAAGGAYMTVAGKYYFNPKIKADGFHIGLFTGFADEDFGIGIGFLGGYKVLSKKGVIFEFGLGLGRSTGTTSAIPYFKLNVGYRFGRNKE